AGPRGSRGRGEGREGSTSWSNLQSVRHAAVQLSCQAHVPACSAQLGRRRETWRSAAGTLLQVCRSKNGTLWPKLPPMPTTFEDAAARLRQALTANEPRLRALGEDASQRPRAAGKWSPRQILGHLCDSAVNNYHRVVRAQQTDELHFPGYQQEHWVAAGG